MKLRKIPIILMSILAISILSFSFSQPAESVLETIEFDTPGYTSGDTTYTEDGFTFSTTGLFFISSGETSAPAMFPSTTSDVITITRVGGGAFGLDSIDIREINSGVGVQEVTFECVPAGGGANLLRVVTTDGLFPDINGAYETFSFPTFTNCTSVFWDEISPPEQPTGIVVYDNFVIDSTVDIEFDTPGITSGDTTYTEDGFTFSTTNQFFISSGEASAPAIFPAGGTDTWTITRVGGGSFGLDTVDVRELNSSLGVQTITFQCVPSGGGGNIPRVVTTDGLFPDINGAYETVSFPTFTNCTSVFWQFTGTDSLTVYDNFVLEPITDTTGPTPTLTHPAGDNPTKADPIIFHVVFDEPIDPTTFVGVTTTITASSGTVQNIVNTDAGANVEFDFEVAGPTEGVNALTVEILATSGIQDPSGNDNLPSNQIILSPDRTEPTLDTFSATDGNANDLDGLTTNSAQANFDFTVSDNVSTGTGISLNCTLVRLPSTELFIAACPTTPFSESSLQEGGGALAAGDYQFTLKVDDEAGNDPGVTVTWTVDLTGLAPAITSPEADPTNSNPLSFAVDFGEAMNASTFDASVDIFVSSGTPQTIVNVDGRNYTFEVLDPSEGAFAVSIPAGQVEDVAGNTNLVSNTFMITDVDFTGATPTIASAEPDPTNSDPVQYTVTFDIAILPGTFTPGTITASSGTVQNIQNTDAGANLAFSFEVATPTDLAQLSVSIAADSGILDDKHSFA